MSGEKIKGDLGDSLRPWKEAEEPPVTGSISNLRGRAQRLPSETRPGGVGAV